MTDLLVDVHAHIYPDDAAGLEAKAAYDIWEYGDDPGVTFGRMGGSLEQLRSTYASAGFSHAVVLALFDTAAARLGIAATTAEHPKDALASAHLADNRWVVHSCTGTGLVPFVGIDPTILGAAQISSHLVEMHDLGAKGVKLHPLMHGYTPDDPRVRPVFELCAEAGLAVLSHSGHTHPGIAASTPNDFAPVLEAFPRLTLVLAHLGGASWCDSAALAEAHPNVLFDLSEIVQWSGSQRGPSPEALVQTIRDIGVDRVMLGSDFPWYDPGTTAELVCSLPGLSDAELRALTGETAATALGLELSATLR